jgi:putative ABC transport system permease protein
MRAIVAALIRCFPAPFRRAFGDDMLVTFEDRWRESPGWRFGARTIVDLAGSAVRERVYQSQQHPKPRKGDRSMTILWQDVKFAIRMLARSPGFTVVALITLALGIGCNTAMFSVANAVLWRSLPYAHPERLVTITEVEKKHPENQWGASYPNFLDWRARTHTLEHLTPILSDDGILRVGSEPVRVSGAAVGYEFFALLGVQPKAGRAFTAAEDQRGQSGVIVLSHRMWNERFGANPAVLGRSIALGEKPFTVVGIMPASFDYPPRAEYWVPLEQVIDPYFVTGRSVWVLTTIARLRDGASSEQAGAEIEAITRQLRHDHPEINRDMMVRSIPLRSQLGRDLRPALLILLGAVALVLLIACGNLAGLMLGRAASRAREMAIRAALGAGRKRLIRQLLTEGLMLSLTGGLLGIALAAWATRSIEYLSKDPRLIGVPMDGSVLLFALAATIATSILFGLAPAIQTTRMDCGEALKQGGARTSSNLRQASARQLLVIGEMALCLVMLACVGLLFKSFVRVMSVDPGFRTVQLVTARISLPDSYETGGAATRFYNQLPDKLQALPGVVGVSAASFLPIGGAEGTGDIHIEGRPMSAAEAPGASFQRALPNYFQVMGIPLLRGREFDQRDDGKDDHVIVINESFARRFWPNENPLGHRIGIGPQGNKSWHVIVGVVKDVRESGLDSKIGFATYEPLTQHPRTTMMVVVRVAGDASSAIAGMRSELRRMEPALLIDQVQTMSQIIEDSVAPRRLNLVLFGLFAGLALVLASVGLYGVVAYSVSQRTQEFGIRMAIGALPRDVLNLVLRQGLKLAVLGVGIGIAAALGVTRLLAGLLFGVEPSDPLTLTGVSLLFTFVALLACWLPAYRATRIAPTVALRWE